MNIGQDTMEFILAIIGTIIAVIQLFAEARERKKERIEEEKKRKEKELIETLVRNLTSVDNAFKEVEKLWGELAKAYNSESEKLEIQKLRGPKFCEEYEKMYTDIVEIYKHLLRNEDMLPYSYGFQRYIDVFRMFMELDKECNILGLKKIVKDGTANDANAITKKINKINNNIKLIRPYIVELQLKYDQRSEG